MNPLKQVREYLKMSQEALAELVDVDQSAISLAEKADRVSPKLAERLAPHLKGLVTAPQLSFPKLYPFVLPKIKAEDSNEAA